MKVHNVLIKIVYPSDTGRDAETCKPFQGLVSEAQGFPLPYEIGFEMPTQPSFNIPRFLCFDSSFSAANAEWQRSANTN